MLASAWLPTVLATTNPTRNPKPCHAMRSPARVRRLLASAWLSAVLASVAETAREELLARMQWNGTSTCQACTMRAHQTMSQRHAEGGRWKRMCKCPAVRPAGMRRKRAMCGARARTLGRGPDLT